MKILGKKLMCLAVVFALTASLIGVHVAEAATQRKRVALATGTTGVVFYILGAGIADLVNKNSKILELTAQNTSGTTENINLLNANEVGFAFTTFDVAYFAYIGGREYTGKQKLENLRLVMMGHVGLHMSIVFADSPYKTMADLKGKRVPTSPGASLLLDQENYKPWGVELVRGKIPILTYTEQTVAMKDGTIDAANYNTTNPASTIMDLASYKPIRILGHTEETMAQVLKAHPYWMRAVVPANTYNGQTEDTLVQAWPYAILCNKDVPDELVREFMQITFDSDLTVYHPDGKYYNASNPNYANPPLVPYHPAAAVFLKEKGLI